MKRLLSVFLNLPVLMVLATSGEGGKTPEKVPGVTDTTITIGAIGDFSGPAVSTMAGYFEGFKDYIQYTNDSGGVNGHKFELRFADDQYNAQKTLAVFRKLIDEGTLWRFLGRQEADSSTL